MYKIDFSRYFLSAKSFYFQIFVKLCNIIDSFDVSDFNLSALSIPSDKKILPDHYSEKFQNLTQIHQNYFPTICSDLNSPPYWNIKIQLIKKQTERLTNTVVDHSKPSDRLKPLGISDLSAGLWSLKTPTLYCFY